MSIQSSIYDLLNFIDESPSPWHAVLTTEKRLKQYDFQCLQESEPWALQVNGRYYVIRDGSSIVAFVAGKNVLAEHGYKIIGAHTDSPGLRIKPHALHEKGGILRVGVEVYGGPILATFTDRDLSFAGRVNYMDNQGKNVCQYVHFKQSLLRLPNLAIHMNRDVNDKGLVLDKQNELPLLFAMSSKEQVPDKVFSALLATACNVPFKEILSWDFNVYDTQKGELWGHEQVFYADSQLDNLASCHAGLSALLEESVLNSGQTLVCAFFDHEEVGSESTKGANSSFLPDILERIALAQSASTEDYKRALANSFMLSVDMAHAYQPNFSTAYEEEHRVYVNKGPVIKINANQRYSSASVSVAMFMMCCKKAQVAYQQYAHHTNMPCGSTIGPILSAKLGIRTVDVGCAMWAMHSIRESAGVQDHSDMIKVMRYFLCENNRSDER